MIEWGTIETLDPRFAWYSLRVQGNAQRMMDKGRTVHERNRGEQVVLHLQVEASSEKVTDHTTPVGTCQYLRHSNRELQTGNHTYRHQS